MLTERQARILSLIVEDYIETAEPVGSEALVRRHNLPLSPATIRNEMARLEEEGYLTHPHTSAGRIPADSGYRVYLESLMEEEALPRDAQETIRHQFHQAGREADAWLHLSAAILAQFVQNAAVVTVPRSSECRFKHLELVEVHENVALLVLVLSQARVRQQLLTFPQPMTQDELSSMAHRLTAKLEGRRVTEFGLLPEALPPEERLVYQTVVSLMSAIEQTQYDEAYLEGVRNVLMQPEFLDTRKALELLEVLDEHIVTRVLPFDRMAREGVSVFIGDENGEGPMRECSVIIAPYGAPGSVVGAMAVLGPTRMRYPRVIPAVRYMTSLLTDLMTSYYA